MDIYVLHRMWDSAIDEGESWARFGAPVQEFLANLYMNRNGAGDQDRAIEMYSAAINRSPDNINLYKRLASLHLHRNEPNLALDVVQRAIKIDPNDKDLQRLFLALIQKK